MIASAGCTKFICSEFLDIWENPFTFVYGQYPKKVVPFGKCPLCTGLVRIHTGGCSCYTNGTVIIISIQSCALEIFQPLTLTVIVLNKFAEELQKDELFFKRSEFIVIFYDVIFQ